MAAVLMLHNGTCHRRGQDVNSGDTLADRNFHLPLSANRILILTSGLTPYCVFLPSVTPLHLQHRTADKENV